MEGITGGGEKNTKRGMTAMKRINKPNMNDQINTEDYMTLFSAMVLTDFNNGKSTEMVDIWKHLEDCIYQETGQHKFKTYQEFTRAAADYIAIEFLKRKN